MMMKKRRDVGFGGGDRMNKDREEELSFFRDIQKREKDQVGFSLLQPVSEEFEANIGLIENAKEQNGSFGNIKSNQKLLGACSRRAGPGHEFLAQINGKNDYNWLKTPPATPLFPSLEMEKTNGQVEAQVITQREIPIIHHLSRFAGNVQVKKTGSNTSISPNSMRKQNPKPTISVPSNNKKHTKSPPIIPTNQKTKPVLVKPTTTPKGINIPNFPSSKIPPTNNRPASATRGRAPISDLRAPQKPDKTSNIIRRQSCSPSVTRGRKVESLEADQKGNFGKMGQVLGSQMVDRFMNNRVSMNESSRINGQRQSYNIKLNESSSSSSSSSSCSAFGRLMSKSVV